MSTRTITRTMTRMLAAASLCTLAACGGGGGGGGDSGGGVAPPPAPPPATMSFTISLDGVDVRRASNGAAIAVDTAGVTQSLTYEE